MPITLSTILIISWNYHSFFLMVLFSFFPPDLPSMLLSSGCFAFSLFLFSLMKIPCLSCSLRSCRPQSSGIFISYSAHFFFLEICFLEKITLLSVICFLLLCVCSQHPVSTRSFLWFNACPPCACVWHLLLYVQPPCDFLLSPSFPLLFLFHSPSLVSGLPCSLDPC